MAEQNISQESRLKNIDETRDHFIAEIKQNELVSKKHKKVCTVLSYIEHLLILASTVTGCVLISIFASLVGIYVGIANSTVGLKVNPITSGI